MSDEVGPPTELFINSGVSPGGTTIENGIETVTVTAPRPPDWWKIAAVGFGLVLAYLLLTGKTSRR